MPRHVTKKSLAKRTHVAVRRMVVPHKDNDYRPHLIRAGGIALLVVIVAAFQLSYNFVQTGSVLGQTTDITTDQLLASTNAQRRMNGEKPLVVNEKLSQAAANKAQDMFAKQYWAHTSPSGVAPWAWFERANYHYAEAGENLARGFSTSDGVVTAWMDSADHRANILDNNYTDIGFAIQRGVLDGKTTTLVVAFYAEPQASSAGMQNDRQAVLAATSSNLGPLTRVGIGIQSMTPALLGSIVILVGAAIIALIAHRYRDKLPFALRKDWRRHHGLYKALGMISLVVVLVMLYGGGQI